MSFKYLFNNNFTDNRLLQKITNYDEEADQISQKGLEARGLLPETIGVTPATTPATTPVTTPKFDPNAGKQDAYNQQLNTYLREYFSERGWSERKEKKAIEYFNRMFNWDWNANAGKRKSAFESEQLKQQERQRQLDRQIEEQEARAKDLEGRGHKFDTTNGWILDPDKVTFSGFDGKNMQTWGNRLQTVFNENKNNKIWEEIAGDDAVITQEELKAWQEKNGLQADGKLGFNTLQVMGLGDQRSKYNWMKPKQSTDYDHTSSWRAPEQLTNTNYTPPWQDPGFIAEVKAKNNASSNQGTSAQTSSTATRTSSEPQIQIFDREKNSLAEKERIWRQRNPAPSVYSSYDEQRAYIAKLELARSNGFVMKQGGIINKYKQGNKMNNEQELQKAFMAYLIEDAAAQGVQIQSEQDLQAYAQQLGEEGLKQKYQEFMQKMQGGQGIKAALGAKLNYIRKIKGMCPDGQETYFFKEGGSIKSGCKPCMAKAQNGQELKKKGNAVQDFKDKRKHINENDTVHTKYGIRDLNGNTKYPKWNPDKENYTTRERQRVVEKDQESGKKIKVDACGGKAKKKK